MLKSSLGYWALEYDSGAKPSKNIKNYLLENGSLVREINQTVLYDTGEREYIFHLNDSTVKFVVQTSKPNIVVKVWSGTEEKTKQVLDEIVSAVQSAKKSDKNE